MSRDELVRVLSPFISKDGDLTAKARISGEIITKIDFYRHKLTGFDNSSAKRDELATRFELPTGMTPNALVEALNIITTKDEFERAASELD